MKFLMKIWMFIFTWATLALTLAGNLMIVSLDLIDKVLMPIADKTTTNKDNIFLKNASNFIRNKAIPIITRLKNWLNKHTS